jgi:glycosyltransferase involved in cell wall biosynthesis
MMAGASPETPSSDPRRIAGPYLLVINIPAAVSGGAVALPHLWAKDVEHHLAVIDEFVLACPVQRRAATVGDRIVASRGSAVSFALVPLPDVTSTLAALLALPRTTAILWRAIGQARIVHCSAAGWPVPLAWVAAALATLRRRFLIVIVESTHWRNPGTAKADLTFHVRRSIFEWMTRWCVRGADLVFYSHNGYRQEFPPRHPSVGHVIPASWIDAENIRSLSEVRADWRAKVSSPAPFRAVFAGALTHDKGVGELLRAAQLLRERAVPFVLDIYGDGPLRGECERAAGASGGTICYRGTLPYGDQFFAALRGGHVLLVPSRSDEQPRVVYDAYSQGVPVIASSTPGLRECVRDRITGILVPPADSRALADAIQRFAANREGLAELAVQARSAAESLTHAGMHERRAAIIEQRLRARAAAE